MALALAAPCAAAQERPDLARAEALLRAGKAQAAWELLAPHEPRHAGRPEFDYLLGIAALESGRPGRATFVLERVLTVNPGHTAARLEIARGYFALGDRERAAREFRAVLGAAPTPGTRSLAQRYLERLEGRPRAAQRLRAYVEAGAGRDSNVNAAASAGGPLVAVPVAGREADRFVSLAAGVTLSPDAEQPYSLFAGADFRQRMHDDLGAFDPRVADVHVGLQARLDERDRVRFSLEHEAYDRGYDSLRRLQGAAVQWIRRVGPRTEASAYAQALRIRYRQPAFEREDADLFIAGVRGAEAFGDVVAAATFYAGRDDATSGRADGDRALAGVGGSLSRRLAASLEGEASVSFLRSDYRGSERDDNYVAIELALRWHLAPDWVLRPRVSRVNNRSNAPQADYGRTEVFVGLRRDLD